MLTMLVLATAGLVATAQDPASDAQVPVAAAVHRIGPDDVLRVNVYGHSDLTQVVVVEADGSFVFPLLGRVSAAGLGPSELEQKLAQLLGEGFIRAPMVSVVIQTYRSSNVYVLGEVTNAGPYPLSDARSVIEVLARAGPLRPEASTEVLVLRRRAGRSAGGAGAAPDTQVIRVDLSRLSVDLERQNVVLQENDTVFVPRAPQVFVSGEVRTPGAYRVPPGATVRQAITMAGGRRRSSARVRIVRTVDGRAQEINAGLDDPVAAGDTIVVGSSGA